MPALFTSVLIRPNFATPSEMTRCAVSGSPISPAIVRIFGFSDGLIERDVEIQSVLSPHRRANRIMIRLPPLPVECQDCFQLFSLRMNDKLSTLQLFVRAA